MPGTYVRIQSVTVGSGGTANIEFTDIPQIYDDILVKASVRNTASNGYDNIQVSFNGAPSGTAYSGRNLQDYVTATISQNNSGQSSFIYFYSSGANATASTFANSELYIPNYTSSSNKSISADSATESNSGSAFTSSRTLAAGLWASSSAITSLRLTPSTGNFAEFSTAVLYGIKRN